MARTSVRYIVNDVDAAISFYCTQLGFDEVMHPAPTFAMLSRGDLRLVLSAPGGGPGGGQAMPDGTLPRPGGWNRFSIEVPDVEAAVGELRAAGARFRNEVVVGAGGKQVLVEDPSGNLVELFQPTRPEARLETGEAGAARSAAPHARTAARFEVRAVGHVESPLTEREEAPRQGGEGAPAAWLVFEPEMAEAIRDLEVGDHVIVLTWLHLSRRDELSTRPGGDPDGPLRGVFSTRSPNRPNPIGLHRVELLERGDLRLLVGGLEAIDGTPVVDVKPVVDPSAER